MNLEYLKESWQEYDRKLTAVESLNEKIIISMIREKSFSTLARMRRNCLLTIGLMCLTIWFCIMSILYNAFDYKYAIQFTPLVLYIIVAIIFIVYLAKEYFNTQVELYHDNLRESLVRVLVLHERFMSIHAKLPFLFISAGILYLINASFNVGQKEGAVAGLVAFAVAMAVNLTLFLAARRFGAFKDHFGIKLKNHLKEIEDFERM